MGVRPLARAHEFNETIEARGLTPSRAKRPEEMPTEILMPALSPTMEEGKLAKWLVKEGQEIKAGDIIAEIETDKATMEVEAADEGKVSKLLVAEGTEGVKVNTPIAVLDGGAPAAPAKAQPQPAAAAKSASASSSPHVGEGRGGGIAEQRPAWLPPPLTPPHKGEGNSSASRPRRRPCARRCATPWPRRCGATRTCS